MVVEGTRRAALAALKVWKVALAKEGRKVLVTETGAWCAVTWEEVFVAMVLVAFTRNGSKRMIFWGLGATLEEDSLEGVGGFWMACLWGGVSITRGLEGWAVGGVCIWSMGPFAVKGVGVAVGTAAVSLMWSPAIVSRGS